MPATAASKARGARPSPDWAYGHRMFVDYAGQTVDKIDAGTGEVRQAQMFVAVMGAFNYTYVEATLTQSQPDWISAHVRPLAFMSSVPAQLD